MKHKLSINGKKPIDVKEYYEVKEKVKLSILLPTDVDVYVSSKDVEGKKEYCDDELFYIFEMPDHDVDVQVEMKNSMVNDNHNNSFMSGPQQSFVGMAAFLKEINGKLEKNDK